MIWFYCRTLKRARNKFNCFYSKHLISNGEMIIYMGGKEQGMFGSHRRKRSSRHPSSHSAGAVWRGPSTLPTGILILSSMLYFYLIFFCSYNFPKLMSEKNCSFNYSLLLMKYLKINIMLLFPPFPFFHYLSNSFCSLILGVFPWHPNGSCCPAIIIPVKPVTSSSIHQPLSSVRAVALPQHQPGPSACPGHWKSPKSSISHPGVLTWC